MAFSVKLSSKYSFFQAQPCITLHNCGHQCRKGLTPVSEVSETAILGANGLDEMGGTLCPMRV